jgi:hypothetical protein
MNYHVKEATQLPTILNDLPDDMKVEVAPGLKLPLSTVAELRKLTVIPCELRVSWPRDRHPESAVKITPYGN